MASIRPYTRGQRFPLGRRRSTDGAAAPPRRVTIVDVARHADVSTTAVSKVLRNAYGASPAMQAKVRAGHRRARLPARTPRPAACAGRPTPSA